LKDIVLRQKTGKLVTISAGICSLSDTVLDKDDLIKKADRALLQAKKMGKNQICVWKDD
jgi:PleD family two-component response regulator